MRSGTTACGASHSSFRSAIPGFGLLRIGDLVGPVLGQLGGGKNGDGAHGCQDQQSRFERPEPGVGIDGDGGLHLRFGGVGGVVEDFPEVVIADEIDVVQIHLLFERVREFHIVHDRLANIEAEDGHQQCAGQRGC